MVQFIFNQPILVLVIVRNIQVHARFFVCFIAIDTSVFAYTGFEEFWLLDLV